MHLGFKSFFILLVNAVQSYELSLIPQSNLLIIYRTKLFFFQFINLNYKTYLLFKAILHIHHNPLIILLLVNDLGLYCVRYFSNRDNHLILKLRP